MPKRASRKTSLPKAAVVLAGIAVIAFIVGEGYLLSRDDSLRLRFARWFHAGDPARVNRIVGDEVRNALTAVGVAPDSIRERRREGGPHQAEWRIGLAPDASLFQANYAITKNLTDHGAAVLSARERQGSHGETVVTMRVGLPSRATHELELVRFPATPGHRRAEEARIALVLYGFEDVEEARRAFDLHLPFAVALEPGRPESRDLFHAARERSREVVLHLPLEPINYPQVNPGPGTILVTMNKAKITQLLKRYFGQAGQVTAVANYMGSLATQDMAVMSAVYDELRRRNVPFIHMTPAPGAVCKSLAADIGVAYEEPDMVIDRDTRAKTSAGLDREWKAALAAARDRGSAVVMMRATPLVIGWLPGAAHKDRLGGVDLVPLAAAIRTPLAL